MSTNFHSFSPNSRSGYGIIRGGKQCVYDIVAGDAYNEVKIVLESSSCVSCGDDAEWEPLNLDGYANIYLYLKDPGERIALDRIECVGVMPLTGGEVLFNWPVEVLEDISGMYQGEIEVRYNTGRIITTFEPIMFNIRNDFSGNGGETNANTC